MQNQIEIMKRLSYLHSRRVNVYLVIALILLVSMISISRLKRRLLFERASITHDTQSIFSEGKYYQWLSKNELLVSDSSAPSHWYVYRKVWIIVDIKSRLQYSCGMANYTAV